MSWLLCVLLGTMAWGQAAPNSPAGQGLAPGGPRPPQAAPAPDTADSVAPDAVVLTINGVCPEAADANAPKPADCKTLITKAQFEKLAGSLAPSITPQLRKQLAGILPRLMAMSDDAKRRGLDKTPQFEETVKFYKMQILSNELQRSIQQEAANVSPEEVEKYYKDHQDMFEQYNVDRVFVPRTKQAEVEAKDDDDKGEKLTDAARQAKEAKEKARADAAEKSMTELADKLRARAAAGEDFAKLQKEAYEAAGMKIETPTVNLPTVRRTGLPPGHAAIFDLKPGQVSQVISDGGGHYIYKVNSKEEIPLEQAKNEIHTKLQSDRMRELMDKVNGSYKAETNEAYFGAGPLVAPPPRGPRMAPGPQGGMIAQPASPSQTPATAKQN